MVLSELYLSSVLSEVHKVQDAAGIIKGNDIRDLKALGEVSGDDLTEANSITGTSICR